MKFIHYFAECIYICIYWGYRSNIYNITYTYLDVCISGWIHLFPNWLFFSFVLNSSVNWTVNALLGFSFVMFWTTLLQELHIFCSQT